MRAKRGTVQSSKDSQSGGSIPKSAGASIRRHNEVALAQVGEREREDTSPILTYNVLGN